MVWSVTACFWCLPVVAGSCDSFVYLLRFGRFSGAEQLLELFGREQAVFQLGNTLHGARSLGDGRYDA